MAQCQHQDIDWAVPVRPIVEKNAPVPMKQCPREALLGEKYCRTHLDENSELVGTQ